MRMFVTNYALLGLALFSLLISNAVHAQSLPTLPIEKMQAQLPKTVSIVFNDESEALYGDLRQNSLHLDKVCEALKKMKNEKPRAIFIDMDITYDMEAAKCIAAAASENNLKLTADYDPHMIAASIKSDFQDISIGSAKILAKTIEGFEYASSDDGGLSWLHPRTRVSLVKPAVLPFIIPAYFINLVNGIDEPDLRKLTMSWLRAVTLADFSEEKTPKLPIQDVIDGNLSGLTGKYAFIGVDQDKYDSMSNPRGEIVNGVFIHQQLTAAYLALMEGDLKPVEGPMIIFGEFVE